MNYRTRIGVNSADKAKEHLTAILSMVSPKLNAMPLAQQIVDLLVESAIAEARYEAVGMMNTHASEYHNS